MKKWSAINKNAKPANDSLTHLAAPGTPPKQQGIPIGSRTASFNYILYEIRDASHKSNCVVSLLIYR